MAREIALREAMAPDVKMKSAQKGDLGSIASRSTYELQRRIISMCDIPPPSNRPR